MEFLFRVSYVELYDEQIRDLLDTNGAAQPSARPLPGFGFACVH